MGSTHSRSGDTRLTNQVKVDGMSATYTWYGVERPSVERLHITAGERTEVRSSVDAGDDHYAYEVILGPGWVFQTLALRTGDGQLRLHRDADGDWFVDEEPRPDLADAVDIDLAFSPFTNTLPIRRLNLPVTTSAEIATAYVIVPSLRVSRDPQRYTRVADDAYLYESLDSDFSRRITVDANGFVLDYPGLFRAIDHHG